MYSKGAICLSRLFFKMGLFTVYLSTGNYSLHSHWLPPCVTWPDTTYWLVTGLPRSLSPLLSLRRKSPWSPHFHWLPPCVTWPDRTYWLATGLPGSLSPLLSLRRESPCSLHFHWLPPSVTWPDRTYWLATGLPGSLSPLLSLHRESPCSPHWHSRKIRSNLEILSTQMDLAENGVIRGVFLKGRLILRVIFYT